MTSSARAFAGSLRVLVGAMLWLASRSASALGFWIGRVRACCACVGVHLCSGVHLRWVCALSIWSRGVLAGAELAAARDWLVLNFRGPMSTARVLVFPGSGVSAARSALD